jgi:hypothetical protein
MYPSASPSNPFALLMDPEAVFRTIEASDRLGALRRHVCRPLDKPALPRAADGDDFDDLADSVAEDSRDGS